MLSFLRRKRASKARRSAGVPIVPGASLASVSALDEIKSATEKKSKGDPPSLAGLRTVDLKLPIDKKAADLKKFQNDWKTKHSPVQQHANQFARAADADLLRLGGWNDDKDDSSSLNGMTYAIGSSETTNDVYFSCNYDAGLFQTVHEVWKNHWNLRTSADDWWFPVACRIAKAIDAAAKPNQCYSEKVRELFVSHQGQEEIKIEVPVYNIYQVNYDMLFSGFSSEIGRRIKVPEYAKNMQCDFTTSSPPQVIASQINLMASMQEFFSYAMAICGCGIKGLEMLGEQADWDRLVDKLRAVRQELSPILSEIRLDDEWFQHVEHVFKHLALTHSEPDSKKVADFWADVLMVGKDWKYGPSGIGRYEVEAYNGWLIEFLTGQKKILKEDMHEPYVMEKLSGLNHVPLNISLTYLNPVVSDQAQLLAGMMGFSLHDPEETFNQVPSLQPNHMWALMLPPDSPLRKD